ncbi:hypothetical protein EMELA_v1c05110 [Mesoplasma melaleucae]|uniref:ABC transporter domain-containing protein n=1 Tax=Mesoplasma melaleucae TaxID=81459 RepID=A0A2K8NW54_9MOLU|nr:hypothetical protein EMELA_v1c05110 [Mesoplasma melaleucae]
MLKEINFALKIENNLSIGFLEQTMDTKTLEFRVEEFIDYLMYEKRSEIKKYLSQFSYSDKIFHKKVKELSEGQKMQLKISLLLCKEIKVLLLDEPTNFLDLQTVSKLLNALEEY